MQCNQYWACTRLPITWLCYSPEVYCKQLEARCLGKVFSSLQGPKCDVPISNEDVERIEMEVTHEKRTNSTLASKPLQTFSLIGLRNLEQERWIDHHRMAFLSGTCQKSSLEVPSNIPRFTWGCIFNPGYDLQLEEFSPTLLDLEWGVADTSDPAYHSIRSFNKVKHHPSGV